MGNTILLKGNYQITTDADPGIIHAGMAAIYPGIQLDTGEPIVAKTLPPKYQASDTRRAMFLEESRILQLMDSPFIVKWRDLVTSHGIWIIMDHISGDTLKARIAEGSPQEIDQVNIWLAEAAAALSHIHSKGYVHLDVKPENLFLTDDGRIVLIDFGIAQKSHTAPKQEGGKRFGSFPYLSPEQEAGRIVTLQSDVYSLGCVVYELVTGKKVYDELDGLDSESSRQHRSHTPPIAPTRMAPEKGIPAWVDDVVLNALAIDPNARYVSASQFAEEFDRHLRGVHKRTRLAARDTNTRQDYVDDVELGQYDVPISAAPREPGRVRRWANKEFRNARRVLLVFATMLALILAFPWYADELANTAIGILPGINTHVINGELRLRSGPGTETEQIVMLPDKQSLTVTGQPRIGKDPTYKLWWPVRAKVDGKSYEGWVADVFVKRTWLMDRVVDYQDASRNIGNLRDVLDVAIP